MPCLHSSQEKEYDCLHLQVLCNATSHRGMFQEISHPQALLEALVDEAVIKTVVNVLTAEEEAVGLQQPSGIGRRPWPLSVNYNVHGSRASTEEVETQEESIFLGGAESRTGFRQQKKFEYAPKVTSDHGERSDTGSIRSFGSGNMSETPSPTPSHRSAGDNVTLTSSPTAGGGPVTSRYFIIKAGNFKTIEASLSRGVWAFTPNTERKMIRVFKEGKRVVLVFSVQGSGHFQGYAYLSADKPDSTTVTADQCFELSGPNLSSPLPIEWIKRANIPFQATRHLLNPYNENKRVQTSRDGQEIEPSIGEALCNLWDKIPQFVPKSTFFGSLKTSQDMPETTAPSKNVGYYGRPIKGYSYLGCGPGYQHYNMNYGHRGQHPK